ncbi:MAG: fibronectin type III domain-containing protein [Lachnospiraceae bacterium]|jgi:Leucine-rich repeat (LRR) protein|nr:fibronectin type III domain-containing protein [Lachnospiraceae bacterium]
MKEKGILKKVVSLALSFAMVFSLLYGVSLTEFNKAKTVKAETSSDGVWEYEEDADGSINITDYKGTEKELSVPKKVDDKIVTNFNVENKVLNSIDFSQCGDNLLNITCSGNKLTSLNVTNNTKLTYLDCSNNQLISLDVSKNTELVNLQCEINQLTSLYIAKNTQLTWLICGSEDIGNQLTSLDVSQNTELTFLDCSSNQLKTLDVSKNTKLTYLGCSNNQLKTLDVSKNIILDSIDCYSNQLISLDVSNNIKLVYLHCNNNQLTSLDISKNIELSYLDCGRNQLKSLDTSDNVKLGYLHCDNNQLKTLDVNHNTQLNGLDCSKNTLALLDVSVNTKLTSLECSNNELTLLDVSNNTLLTNLGCGGNKLTSLNIDKNPQLKVLQCGDNKIISLDVSQNTQLTYIICSNNKLTKLDVSKNPQLTVLYCYNNYIINTKDLINRFGESTVLPQNISTPTAPTTPVLKNASKYNFNYDTSDVYNGKRQSANVYSKVSGIGKIVTYYRAKGSNTYTTAMPYKAGNYYVYVKTTAGKSYKALTSYMYLGVYRIYPHPVSRLYVKPGNNKITVSWKNASTNKNNVTKYRVYYKEKGHGWKYKTYSNRATHKVTLKLKNKKKYSVTVRVYCNGLLSSYPKAKTTKTK